MQESKEKIVIDNIYNKHQNSYEKLVLTPYRIYSIPPEV
jgi:hypothetical protein